MYRREKWEKRGERGGITVSNGRTNASKNKEQSGDKLSDVGFE